MATPKRIGTRLRQLLAALDGDVQRIYDELAVPFRPRFFPFVQALLHRGESAVTALAEEAGVSQPAATQTLAEMARLGLVRLTAAEDKRARRVTLTPQGERLAETLQPVWNAVHAAAEDLDCELAHPLSETVDGALAALRRRPFLDRIRHRMNDD